MAKRPKKTFRIAGRVVDRKTRQGVSGLRVEAWDKDLIINDLVGSAGTDAQGAFHIEFDQSHFKELFLDRQPDLFFKVFRGDVLITSTEDSVLWNVRAGEAAIVIEVEIPVVVKPKDTPFVVKGRVTLSDGSPFAGGLVRAFDKDLRSRQPLGDTHTDRNGAYHIEYSREQFTRAEKDGADLVVEVSRETKVGEEFLVGSNVLFNAPPVATVNLTVPLATIRVPSELDRYMVSIAPLLEGARVLVPDLNDEDIAFIAGETGIAREHMDFLVKAARLERETRIDHRVFYACSRKGLPVDLPALLDVPTKQRAATVEAAIVENLVSSFTADEKQSALSALDKLHEERKIDRVLDKPLPGRQLKVRQVLEVAGLETEPQRTLARALAGKDLHSPNLWSGLQADTGLSASVLERVQFTLRTAELADDHLATLTALHRDERVRSVRDLAKHYDPETWQALVTQTVQKDGGDLPADISGATVAERRATFARRIYTRVATVYPTVAMAYGLSRKLELAATHAAQWLPRIVDAHEGFDLATARLDAFVREQGAKLGISKNDAEAVKEDLKRVQRVYRLKPDLAVVSRLLHDKLDSSAAILHKGKAQFVANYGKDDAMGRDTAVAIYQQAEVIAVKAFGLYAHFSPTINTQHEPAVLGECPAELKGVPNYATLFGSLDGCECEPCESVYSPAAYLTDLLAFLEREIEHAPNANQSVVPVNGLEALKTRSFCDRDSQLVSKRFRRPDILDVKLSCRNAETLMPYVDLVLEILENAVPPNPSGHSYQTGLTEEQLSAQPEHVKEDAYTTFATSIFPFSLPFDLWHEEEAIYLEKLGTSRAELLETFFPYVSGDPHDLTEIRRWKDRRIAAAYLGLTDLEWELISGQALPNTGPLASAPPHARFASETWGFPFLSGANWWHPLQVADKLMERSGLGYEDLLQLLTLRSFNPQGYIAIDSGDVGKCDPKKIRLSGLDETALEFLHRFLRLQRALGWSLQELDQALMSLAPPNAPGDRPSLNEDLLVRISHLIRMRKKFNLPVVEVLAWWSMLDTADYSVPQLPHQPPYRSRYEILFQPGSPGNTQYEAFKLNAARTELSNTSIALSEQLPAISGVLRISQPDLVLMIRGTLSDTNPKVNRANLSTLYRHASLARALGLTIEDYMTLKTLLNFEPFNSITLHFPLQADEYLDVTLQTLRFVERVEAVKNSGFSIMELDYLLRQTMPFDGKTVAPTDKWVDESLKTLRESQKPLAVLAAPLTLLKQALDRLAPGATPTPTGDDLRPLIEETLALVNPNGGNEDKELRTVLQEALTFVSPGTLLQPSALSLKLTSAQEKFAAIRKKVLVQALATALADVLGLSVSVCEVLLKQISLPAVPPIIAGDAFLKAFDLPAEDPAAQRLPELLRRLHKAALVIAKLGITYTELPLFMTMSNKVGWLELATLPVRGADQTVTPPRAADPAVSFDAWARSVKLFKFRDALPEDQREQLFSLFDIAAQYSPSPSRPHAIEERRAYKTKLKSLTHWEASDLDALLGLFDVGALSDGGGGGMLRPIFPEHFRDERLLARLTAAMQLLKRLGTTAYVVDEWIVPAQNPQLRSDQVNGIKNALVAVRHGESWPEVLKPLCDPLREQQRQALVTYLMHKWALEGADELYDHFLIDVEMSPCMMTSRLIQATSAVQLFVQRVLMNLEPGLALSDEAVEQWDWMKNYRVWEANRKIFLYPENWIEPELRDDKTPFFKDLENELRQADITNETAETALLHYLEKLHEVGRLQVCGQYLDMKSNPATVHVFARTREVPYHYYYRKGILDGVHDLSGAFAGDATADSYWTPWERVDVDIEGDHLIPMVYNRRVYLFWPIFSEKDDAPFSQLDQQIIKLFQFGYQITPKLLELGKEIAELVQSLVQMIVSEGVGAALDGINRIIGGLNDIRETFINAHIELNIDSQPNLAGLGKWPGFDDLLGEIKKLVDGATGSADDIFRGIRTNFPEIASLTPPSDLTYTDPSVVVGKISGLIKQIVEMIGPELDVTKLEEKFLSLVPAKRLEVQLAWSEFKNDCWSAKKTSSGLVSFRDVIAPLFEALPRLPGAGKLETKRLFTFKGEIDETTNKLTIRCRMSFKDKDDPGTYVPTDIGLFRYSSCNGRMEAVDLPHDESLAGVFQEFFEDLKNAFQATNDNATKELQGIQSFRIGEPATPDDDPKRPSVFRRHLQEGFQMPYYWIPPLPLHFYPPSPTEQNPQRQEDIYRILALHQSDDFLKLFGGFFYQDAYRSFYCHVRQLPKNNVTLGYVFGYVFFPFYHPYTCALLENIQRAGIPGIYHERYKLDDHGRPQKNSTGEPLQSALKNERFFQDEYAPAGNVYNPSDGDPALRPIEEFNFSNIGAYAQYNWEIFFHIPLLIATRLVTNQKFREAQHWFHYIFNPTDASRGSAPEKYWRTRPFVKPSADGYQKREIDQLLQLLNAEGEIPDWQETERAVRKWRQDAFNPHLVARTRTTAFQKTVVMKYIDNLIAWGDSLFHRETREAVNEATQLYLLAAKLLGPRPRRIPRSTKRPERSFNELKPGLDAFSNALVEFENYLPATGSALGVGDILPRRVFVADRGRLDRAALAHVDTAGRSLLTSPSLQDVTKKPTDVKPLYFCVPPNAELLEYWDRVADRLFKIRHCQNIEGQALQLALLAPPIDPAILVRAKAMGVDIDSVLSELYAPLPHYRFQMLAQKATELCGEVKSLGAALLSALEKRDGEALALLRNTQETRLLEAVRAIKEHQITEATLGLEGLKHSQEATTIRRDHHQRLLMEFMNPEEAASAALGAASMLLQVAQAGAKAGAAAGGLVPNIKAGFVTTLGAMFGGQQIGDSAERVADAFGHLAGILSSSGGLISTMGGYRRRAEDWLLQIALANKELEGLETQIAAAEIRVAVAELDLANHKLQIRHSKETNDFMQKKFTNQERYDWMVSQVSTLYFQTYQLAFDLARKCERAFAHELGVDSPGLIHPGYWDNLKKGLLAGEQLNLDLKRLEVAYLEQNKREIELTKHVSLRQLNPVELLSLKVTGKCEVTIPEWLYDLDCPGHYMRRIKSVALSIPSVVGPYTSVNCTLSLQKSSLRKSPNAGDKYARQGSEDDRFLDYIGAVQSIVTSSGQNDSGLFETNLRDERFLPFEGAGAESTWKLDLPKDYPAFDYSTISDVIVHVRYTARQGVDPTKVKSALDALFGQADQAGLALVFSLRHDFPTEWSAFVNGQGDFTSTIRKDFFPYFTQGKTITITGLDVYDGTAVSNYHAVGDPGGATTALRDSTKLAFTLTAPQDGPGTPQVLTRTASAQVFLIIHYSLS